MSKRISRRTLLSVIVSLSLILFLFYRVGVSEFWETVSRIDGTFLVLACLIAIPNEVARSLRWSQILKAQKIRLSLSNSLQYFLMGLYASVITPAKIGDLLRSYLLSRKEKKSFGFITASVIFDRILDLGLMIGIATLGVLLIFTPEDLETNTMQYAVLLLVIFTILAIFAAYIAFSTEFGRQFLSKFGRAIIGRLPKTFSKTINLDSELDDFFNAIDLYRSNYSPLVIATIISAAAWIIYGFQGYVLLLAFGEPQEVSFWVILFFIAFTSFAALLPFTISGIGFREALFIAFFGSIGIAEAEALAFSLVFITIGAWIPALFGGFLLTKRGISRHEIV